jgi:hypothetical protein
LLRTLVLEKNSYRPNDPHPDPPHKGEGGRK